MSPATTHGLGFEEIQIAGGSIFYHQLRNSHFLHCIGYSGKVINKKHLSENFNSKPKIFLMHGANDTIVPPPHLLEAKEYLKNYGINAKTKIFKDCEHKIPIEGSSLGLSFLKKNLL